MLGGMSQDDVVKKVLTLPLTLQEGTLIDFETTGIPLKTPPHEAITLGYFEQNRVVVLQRKSLEKEPFYSELRGVLAGLSKPYYAYNAQFERDMMRHELGMSVVSGDFVDLMRGWKVKSEDAGIKWPGVSDLMSEPEDYYNEPKITGKRVPSLWKLYTETKADWVLKQIIDHCLSDVLREAVLLLRYPGSAEVMGD
jgi:hypothetical protein